MNSESLCEFYEYRIKPEPPKPREWWLVPGVDMIKETKKEAQLAADLAGLTEVIHVREVL